MNGSSALNILGTELGGAWYWKGFYNPMNVLFYFDAFEFVAPKPLNWMMFTHH